MISGVSGRIVVVEPDQAVHRRADATPRRPRRRPRRRRTRPARRAAAAMIARGVLHLPARARAGAAGTRGSRCAARRVPSPNATALTAGGPDVQTDDDLGRVAPASRPRPDARAASAWARTAAATSASAARSGSRTPRIRGDGFGRAARSPSGTTRRPRASFTGAPSPRRWHTQAASARVAPGGSRPAARSRRSDGQNADRQLLRAVRGDLVEAVADARVGEPLEQRGAVGGDVLGRQAQVRGGLVPPLLAPRPGTSSSAIASATVAWPADRPGVGQQRVAAVEQPQLALLERRDVVGERRAGVLPARPPAGERRR